MRPEPSPKSHLPSDRVDVAALVVVALIAAGMVTFTIQIFSLGLDISVWRHDAIYYSGEFGRKLSEEGRWLTYLLFDGLIRIPGSVAWLIILTSWFCYAYTVAYRATDRAMFAGVFSLTALHFLPVYSLALWPGVTLTVSALLVVALLVHRSIPRWVFFLLFGVLLHGSFQRYYFVLPLLFLRETALNENRPLSKAAVLLSQWFAGFVVGYAFSMLVMKAITGDYFIDIAEWRRASPVRDWVSLKSNLAYSASALTWHLSAVLQDGKLALPLAVALAVNAFRRSLVNLSALFMICAAVALALYAALLPIGVAIPDRSSIALFTAIIAAVYLQGPIGRWKVIILSVSALMVFMAYHEKDIDNLRWYQTVTETYRQDATELAKQAAGHAGVLYVIDGTAIHYQRRIERERGLPAPYFMEKKLSMETSPDFRWMAAALEAGFSDIRFCEVDATKGCDEALAGLEVGRCLNEHPDLCHLGATSSGSVVVRFKRHDP